MTQAERVKEYMKQNGTITSMEAFANLGITRLAARIKNLRDDGVAIRTTTVCKTRKDGTTCRFAEYSLVKSDGE